MGWIVTELKQALRALARWPGYTAVIVLTLGLGIGVNVTIFSAVHRLILAPMPFEDGDRLAVVWRESADNGMLLTPEPAAAAGWTTARTFEAAFWRSGEATLTGAGGAERITVYGITPNLPALVRVRPLVGRTMTDEEARTRAPVALISEGLWHARFGGRRDAVGATLRIDDRVVTVVGVMPARFAGFDAALADEDVWVPLAAREVADLAAGELGALIRLAPAVTFAQASEELDRLAAADGDDDWRYRAVEPGTFLGGGIRSGLLVLLGAVTLVLLIACANIAALLLARLSSRERDIAVRTALGASRGRLLASIAGEALVLAVLGGVAGLMLASWSIDALRVLRPERLDALDAVTLSGPIVAYAAALALLTGVLFGLAPAAAMLGRQPAGPLHGPIAAGSRGARTGRARAGLVVAQVALSVALLIGALLLTRTFVHLRSADVGFDADGLLAVEVSLPEDRYATPAAIAAFVERVTDGLRAVPGVLRVADAVSVPPVMGVMFGKLHVDGHPPAEQGGVMAFNMVGPDYFTTLGAPLVEGREFTEAERSAPVLIVDEAFARAHWPGETAIGKRLRLSAAGEWQTVIGVAPAIAARGPAAVKGAGLYGPHKRSYEAQSFLLRVAEGSVATITPQIRGVVEALDPHVAILSIATMETRMAASIGNQRFLMALLGSFALLAVALSALGLYGLLSYTLAQRTREIGVRLALGATPREVRDMLLAHGAKLAAAGIAVGLAGAWAGARTLASLLHGVTPHDVSVYVLAAAATAAVALLASWLPARRARRVDPMVTLRGE